MLISSFVSFFGVACYQEERLISLTEGWEYKALDGPAAAGAPSDWTAFELGEVFRHPEEFEGEGRFLLRRRIAESELELAREAGALAFFGGQLSDVAIFRLNGVEFGGVGSLPPDYRSGTYNRLLADLPFDALNFADPTSNFIEVELYSNGVYPFFFADPRMRLGAARDLYAWYFREEIIAFCLLAVYFAVGGYHLLLFWRRRQDLHNLFFGALCVVLTAYWFFRTGSRDLLFAEAIGARIRIEYVLAFSILPLMGFFLVRFFRGKYERLVFYGVAAYASYCGLLGLYTVFGDYDAAHRGLFLWQMSAPLAGLGLLAYTGTMAVYGNRDARYLIIGLLLLILAGLHDILASTGVIDAPHIARYAFTAFILGIAAVLANRFVRVHRQVEELNAHLEERVEERTRQLQESLNEIRELKVQQDGDYFLTSLLITPLGGNFADNEFTDVDILVRQKKRFQFRKWEAEIGGDLCSAHSIRLRGRRYTAFLNADAMGKSIQGAGGALVTGALFKSIVSRTAFTAGDLSPERWLKDCFLALQDLFVSFDGSMLISAVMGLVDDESGMLYYVNAEHPWVVLYREGRAQFLEDQLILRKIGIHDVEGHLAIKTFAFRPSDVILVGSDGRDDILIGMDERGHRIINEDERMFLRRVEEGSADLERIQDAILRQGDLTDDFTLIRLAWRMDEAVETTRARADEAGRLREQAEAAARRAQELLDREREQDRAGGRYSDELIRAAVDGFALYEEWIARFPHGVEELSIAARLARAAGRTGPALDCYERARLRDPGNVGVLAELASLLIKTGDRARARKVLAEALEAEPNNARAKDLLAKLDAPRAAG